MTNDPVDYLRLIDKRYDPHLTTIGGAQQRVHDLTDHLGPAFGGHIEWLIFNYRGMRRIDSCLTPFAPRGIGVEAVVAHHDLTFVRNMEGDSGDKFQIIH